MAVAHRGAVVVAVVAIAVGSALLCAPAAADARRYAEIDGTDNNAKRPEWGAAGGRFARLMPARFADGASDVADGPPPRDVSNALFGIGPFAFNRLQVSSMAAAWGQYIAHDTILTTGQVDRADGLRKEEMVVEAPVCDARMDPFCEGGRGFNVTRLAYDPTTGDSPYNPRMPLNLQTAFIDGSAIYGPDAERSRVLRSFVGGKLLADAEAGTPVNTEGHEMEGHHAGPITQMRLGGDIRANVNPGLLSLIGVFVLEHNRWCDHFKERMPGATDETLFQEARRMVRALIQHVTVTEYAPVILGDVLPPYTGYDEDTTPAIDLFFATASYRYGHSGINSIYPTRRRKHPSVELDAHDDVGAEHDGQSCSGRATGAVLLTVGRSNMRSGCVPQAGKLSIMQNIIQTDRL
mmetsp:Transcript_2529/g.8642  ORF Transcript_2529/g.8642 Transcript_2529/m.8642 type:complete len:407 (-) Transcript_2529:533-1753(-)